MKKRRTRVIEKNVGRTKGKPGFGRERLLGGTDRKFLAQKGNRPKKIAVKGQRKKRGGKRPENRWDRLLLIYEGLDGV